MKSSKYKVSTTQRAMQKDDKITTSDREGRGEKGTVCMER